MTKTKTNKYINKQTNKKTNKRFLDPIYLCQIKSDLHKILRVSDGDPSATKWGPFGPPLGSQRVPIGYPQNFVKIRLDLAKILRISKLDWEMFICLFVCLFVYILVSFFALIIIEYPMKVSLKI